MFNLGPQELIIIAIVALIIIPPSKLPGFATTLGRIFRKAQMTFLEMKHGIETSVEEPKSDASLRGSKTTEAIQDSGSPSRHSTGQAATGGHSDDKG